MQAGSPSSGRIVRPHYELNWLNIVSIGVFHLVALLAFVPYFFDWRSVVVCMAGTVVFGTLGIQLFYHRCLTHKGFQCPKWLERCLAVLAVCSFQDTPAHWVAVHRKHHEHADDEPDPHSPIRSFLWAHIGWLLVKAPDMSRYEIYARYAKDVLRDPFYRRLESQKYYLGIFGAQMVVFLAAGFSIELFAGGTFSQALRFALSLLVWGVFVRTVLYWHNSWAINSITHLWGYRNYETGEHSRNNILFGLIALGEGWHNNHHADPRSARHGHRWWEIDGTYLIIRLLGALGLAWRITEPNISPNPTMAPRPVRAEREG
ncbi:MAG: fatty acid desaturase [Nitratireductor sp.]